MQRTMPSAVVTHWESCMGSSGGAGGGGGAPGSGGVEGGGGNGGAGQSKRHPSTITCPSVPAVPTETVPAASKVKEPSSFHWPPLAVWSTVTVVVPSRLLTDTGTLVAWLYSALHQRDTRYVPLEGADHVALLEPLPWLESCR